ncbi:MAG: hypothetical protein GX417_11195 [Clostridiales bacterium]|nr:hypothetical protein [Clostridiales bacterium]
MMKKTLNCLNKRILPVVLAMLFLMVFSASSLAASDKTDRGNGKPDRVSEKNENKNTEKDQKQKTEEAKKRYRGISIEKIGIAIESVTDEATKLELTALLDAYIAALTDKDAALGSGNGSLSELSQLASDTRSVLKEGLEAAGFTLGSVLGWQEWKDYGNEQLDLAAIALAIAALDDSDENKAALELLLSAYESALAALETADEENEELLGETMKDARESLLEALYFTGISPFAQPEVPEETTES